MGGVTATKLDGKLYRDEIVEDLTRRVAALKDKGVTPGLATVLVGDDPASHSYVKMKHRDCEQIGVNSIRRDLPADVTQEELNAVIDELNADPECTGYIVQLPLPKHLDENAVLERIDPAKDADGLHPVNLGKLVLMEPAPLPCTPNGALSLLRHYNVELNGAKAVVIGRGVTVGRSDRPDAHPTLRERHCGAVSHRHQGPCGGDPRCRHHHRRRRSAAYAHRRHGQARRRGAGCRGFPGRRQARR